MMLFILTTVLALGVVLYAVAGGRWPSRSEGRPGPGIYLAGLVPAFVFLALLWGGPDLAPVLLFVTLLAAAVVWWFREFINLMGLADEAFPGRNDKALWFALLVLLPPVGVVAFSVFRRIYGAAEKPVQAAAMRELS